MLHDYIEPSQRFIACPNQDVAYGLGFFDLDAKPAVIQVPNFGERFWVYAHYDQRTNQQGEVGKLYDSELGFYLLVGPNWNGDIPDGGSVVTYANTGANHFRHRHRPSTTAPAPQALESCPKSSDDRHERKESLDHRHRGL